MASSNSHGCFRENNWSSTCIISKSIAAQKIHNDVHILCRFVLNLGKVYMKVLLDYSTRHKLNMKGKMDDSNRQQTTTVCSTGK